MSANHEAKCHHIFKVVYRFGMPILVCLHCPKEVP